MRAGKGSVFRPLFRERERKEEEKKEINFYFFFYSRVFIFSSSEQAEIGRKSYGEPVPRAGFTFLWKCILIINL